MNFFLRSELWQGPPVKGGCLFLASTLNQKWSFNLLTFHEVIINCLLIRNIAIICIKGILYYPRLLIYVCKLNQEPRPYSKYASRSHVRSLQYSNTESSIGITIYITIGTSPRVLVRFGDGIGVWSLGERDLDDLSPTEASQSVRLHSPSPFELALLSLFWKVVRRLQPGHVLFR
jgi:hypothetical protein